MNALELFKKTPLGRLKADKLENTTAMVEIRVRNDEDHVITLSTEVHSVQLTDGRIIFKGETV